jgi:hypothetical protein
MSLHRLRIPAAASSASRAGSDFSLHGRRPIKNALRALAAVAIGLPLALLGEPASFNDTNDFDDNGDEANDGRTSVFHLAPPRPSNFARLDDRPWRMFGSPDNRAKQGRDTKYFD